MYVRAESIRVYAPECLLKTEDLQFVSYNVCAV